MSCLLPQFKSCPDSVASSLKFQSHNSSRSRDIVSFRTHCSLSTSLPPRTSTLELDNKRPPSLEAAVCELEKLRSSDTRPIPIDSWRHSNVVRTPSELNLGSDSEEESAFFLGDETVITEAACRALALARTACKLAREAAVDNSTPTTTVKSTRHTERKTKRIRAVEKAYASASAASAISRSSSRKKTSNSRQMDYADPLRYLKDAATGSRLLTASEERVFSEGTQALLKLERLHSELSERLGDEPTWAQWAAAARVDEKTLKKQINYGVSCKDRMIKSNIRLVFSIAKNYQGAGLNLQDLIQEGCRGLVRGLEKFDASKGFKFSTYAHWWIKQAATKQLYSKNGRFPSDEEVARATGLSMKRLSTVLLVPKAPRSLDQKIGPNIDLKPLDITADRNVETSEDLLMKKVMKQELLKVLDSLSPREKQVVELRFGLEDGRKKTLLEIGELMGVSRERIRQIEACTLRKLKNKKSIKNLQQYVMK